MRTEHTLEFTTAHASRKFTSVADQATDVHDDPDWRALAQPHKHIIAYRHTARTTPVRLCERAGAHDEAHMRTHAVACPQLPPQGLDAVAEHVPNHRVQPEQARECSGANGARVLFWRAGA